MSKLILDTLYPPALPQLLDDIAAAGADGVAVYVWRPGGVGSWTPALAQGVRDAGKLMFPIIVPAVDGGDINGQLGAAQAFGFTGGPITLDLEPPNLPGAAWEEAFDRAAVANGFQDFDYGTPSYLGHYQPDDDNWVADWIRTGQLQPLPLAPAHGGWQFVNDVPINGRSYDASVIADVIFGGDMSQLDDIQAALNIVNQRTAEIYNLLVYADTGAEDSSGEHKPLAGAPAIMSALSKLQAGAGAGLTDTQLADLEQAIEADLEAKLPGVNAQAVLQILRGQFDKL